MDIQQIQDIVNLVTNSQLAEVEIKSHGKRIRVKNNQFKSETYALDAQSQLKNETENLQALNQNTIPPENHIIKSVHIGRFKLSADAISEPLIKVGDNIQQGDTLGYVACMAQLLPIIADKAGCIATILVEDNAKVEYGTPIVQLH